MRFAGKVLRAIGNLLAICSVVIAIAGQSASIRAQAPDPSDQVHLIAKLLNCPTCGGRNLADCPTDTCTQWKEEIRSQLAAGKSQSEVIDYFKARFGPTVLQEPPKEGVILLLWVTPVVLLIAILAAGVAVLRQVTSKRESNTKLDAHDKALAVDSYVAQIEEEVGKP